MKMAKKKITSDGTIRSIHSAIRCFSPWSSDKQMRRMLEKVAVILNKWEAIEAIREADSQLDAVRKAVPCVSA